VFKYAADRLPVTIILLLSVLDFSLYFIVENVWLLAAFWLVMIVPKGNICAWSHHHQHILTFKQKWLNRVLEQFHALHTGITTNLWMLHHVLGHHQNYLDQTKDESRWKRRSGKTMGELEYTFAVAGTAYYRGFKVGDRFPKIQRIFVLYSMITVLIVGILTYFDPVAALFLFILPMLTSLLLTAWATYRHHSDLDTENEFAASRNNLNRFYNVITGNLGYHTAHHHEQGVHWSLLPELHEQIQHKIPADLIKVGSV
jgi:fatty acid desaturase